jgi:hypothetical protein
MEPKMKLEDCKKKGPVTKEFIEQVVANGKGGSHDVVQRLVGMVLNGKKSFESGQPAPEEAEPVKKND